MTRTLDNPARNRADGAQADNIARIFDRALWASVTDTQDLEFLPAAAPDALVPGRSSVGAIGGGWWCSCSRGKHDA